MRIASTVWAALAVVAIAGFVVAHDDDDDDDSSSSAQPLVFVQVDAQATARLDTDFGAVCGIAPRLWSSGAVSTRLPQAGFDVRFVGSVEGVGEVDDGPSIGNRRNVNNGGETGLCPAGATGSGNVNDATLQVVRGYVRSGVAAHPPPSEPTTTTL